MVRRGRISAPRVDRLSVASPGVRRHLIIAYPLYEESGRRYAEQQIGEAVVVPRRRAEPVLGAVGAAQEEVQVVLPRVADAAVDLDARPWRPASPRCPAAALATCTARWRSASSASSVIAAYCAAAVARSTASEHVGELVLDRLERADRHVELDALLRVRERHVEQAARGADHLGRERDGRARRARRRARRRRCAVPVPARPRSSTSKTRREKSIVSTRPQRRQSAGATTRTVGPGVDDRRSSRRGRPRGRTSSRGSSFGRHTPSVPASATVPVASPASTVGEPLVARARRAAARTARSVGKNGPGRGDVAGLLDEQAEVGARTVAERGEVAQVRPRAASAAVGSSMCARTQRRRALLGEQRARGVAQQLLLVGEREVHRSAAASPRESPSTRWAMMLRWISDVPPAIVLAKLMKNMSTQRPCSSPRSGSRDRAVRALELHAELVQRPCRAPTSPSSCTSARAPTSPGRSYAKPL